MKITQVYSQHFSQARHLLLILGSILRILPYVLTMFAVAGLHKVTVNLQELTDDGKYWYRPDYDLPIYIFGVALCMGVAVYTLWEDQKKPKKTEYLFNRFVQILIVFAVHLFFLLGFKSYVGKFWQTDHPYAWKVLSTITWGFLCILPTIVFQSKRLIAYVQQLHTWFSKSILMQVLTFLFVILSIFLLVYTPDWKGLAGTVFILDQFHHWEGFAFRAVVALENNLRLGQDVYVQYGVGWPLLFHFLNATFGRILQMSVLYAVIYYSGMYLLLRFLTKQTVLSLAGLFIILHFQLFFFGSDAWFWQSPASSILRTPFDVWFFLALWLRLSKVKVASLLVSISMTLGLIFEFDTGIYLVITYTLLGLASLTRSLLLKNYSDTKSLSKELLATYALMGLALGGFFYASRSFISVGGLFEGLRQFGGGISHLPIAAVSPTTFVEFIVILCTYLVTIVFFIRNSWVKKSSNALAFIGAVAIYGLGLLLMFVGRSHRLNIFYTSMPFWIIVIFTSALFRKLSVSILLFCIFGILLFTNTQFHAYPNVLHSVLLPNEQRQTCLPLNTQDVCGSGDLLDQTRQEDLLVIAELGKLKPRAQIAIFDRHDTRYYQNLEQGPFFRFEPSLVFTKKQLELIIGQISSRKPDYVLIKKIPEPYNDVWYSVHDYLEAEYSYQGPAGPFEIWKSKVQ